MRQVKRFLSEIRLMRMTLIVSHCNDCHHAIADTVSEDASCILLMQRVWGCTLFVYLLSNGPQCRKPGESV
jgi:hypothetical protein